MSQTAQPGAGFSPGRVKWKRFAYVMVPAAAVAAALIGLTAKGAVSANISVSGREYLVTADEFSASGFEQFANYDTQSNGTKVPVAVSALKSATIKNLCQAVDTGVGNISIILKAGTPSQPVSASNLVVDASELGGDATFQNIAIGQDAGQLSAAPANSSGNFGESANSVVIEHLVQHTWLTQAGTFTLPGLNLKVSTTGAHC
jgi:hypothetical protein